MLHIGRNILAERGDINMKKHYFILIFVCLVMLCGCQASANDSETSFTLSTSVTTLCAYGDGISEFEPIIIPDLYEDILNDYGNLVRFRLSSSFEDDWNAGRYICVSETLARAQADPVGTHTEQDVPLGAKWSDMLVTMTNGINDPQISSFGYILKDINRDGFPELFWTREDRTVLAVFTIQNGSVVLIDAFSTRHSCVVSESWNLYIMDYGGAGYTHYKIQELDIDGNLSVIIQFGTCGFTNEGNVICYQTLDQKELDISESIFNKLLLDNPFLHCKEYLDCQITYLSTGDGSLVP